MSLPLLESQLQVVTQELLYQQLTSLFPGDQIQLNVKKTTNIKYPTTGNYMEFDIWIPSHSLCFEFQDSYHYMTTWYFQNTQRFIQLKDNMKNELARQQGFCLVSVPYWWNGSQEQLAHTINFCRPGLDIQLDFTCDPVNLNPPLEHIQAEEIGIPNVGELMLASVPATLKSHLSESAWWLGEKYDGIRCCWSPDDLDAYTRYGKEIPLVDGFVRSMPSITLDSEIWLGRGQYSTLVLSGTEHSYWPNLRIVSFDVPSLDLQHLPYEERYAQLVYNVPPENPFTCLAVRLLYIRRTIGLFAQAVIDNGGEGLILQKYNSLYEQGRSQSVLKLKTTQADQEGIIVKVWKNKSVSLKLPQGTTVIVPPEDVLIPKPTVGDIVTFSFDANSRRDTPSNPKIYRIRSDVGWEDIARNFRRDKHNAGSATFTSKPQGYWTSKNMRAYMENFAKRRNLDPLIPETWLHSFSEFVQSKNSRAILGKFKSGYLHALQHLFPEVKFDPSAFQQAYYKIENRRKFFENYAKSNDFDPLVPDNWYSQVTNKIMSVKGAGSVISYHAHSIARALLDLFPNIGLEKSKLRDPEGFWTIPANRRKFFENFAIKRGFDPLVPKNWYNIPRNRIMATQGIHTILPYHNYSISLALVDLFQDIGLENSKFKTIKNYWAKKTNRQKFFEAYAKNNGFDPHNPESWYRQSGKKIWSTKGAGGVMSYYNNSISQALADLFPDIGIDKLRKYRALIPRVPWNIVETRRKFFERYAQQHSFDFLVPENWYNQPMGDILSYRGTLKVIAFHGNSVPKALADLFPSVRFDPSQFDVLPQHWDKIANRREFFNRYARENKFDPLNAEEWYSQTKTKILSNKGAYGVMYHYNGNVAKALVDLFPNIGLDLSRFGLAQRFWQHPANRRKFFTDYAKEHKFDPLIPKNWYLAHSQISDAKVVAQYHNNSVEQALLDLFPEIGLQKHQLELNPNRILWSKVATRRAYFERYAKKRKFDPLNPDGWYAQQKIKLVNVLSERVAGYHGGSIAQALCDLFPDVGFDKAKLKQLFR